jgi:hypothetical protein
MSDHPRWEVSMNDRPVELCLSDEELEDLLFRRLAGGQLEAVEEHLLFCPACQSRVSEEERFVRDFRAAAGRSRPGVLRSPPVRWTAYSAIAASLVLGFWMFRAPPANFEETGDLARVHLTLTRSVSPEQAAAVSARRPFSLVIDLEQLPSFERYAVEVATAQGSVRFRREAVPAQGVIEVEAGEMEAGLYWVRLHGDGKLVREYGLRVSD